MAQVFKVTFCLNIVMVATSFRVLPLIQNTSSVESAAAAQREVQKLALNVRFREKQILDHVLGPGIYDRRIRPAGVFNESGNTVEGSTFN